MKKNKVIIISLIVILLAVGSYLGVKNYLNKDLKNKKQDLQETIEKYGYVEKENVATSIAKFNTEIMENKIGNLASDEYMVVQDNLYWYGLFNDVSLYIEPETFTENKNNDITKTMAIYYSKTIEDETIAINYVKDLIKANNDNLTAEEIDYLITEAKNLSKDKKISNNGKGISVGYIDHGEKIEYQVIRLYK